MSKNSDVNSKSVDTAKVPMDALTKVMEGFHKDIFVTADDTEPLVLMDYLRSLSELEGAWYSAGGSLPDCNEQKDAKHVCGLQGYNPMIDPPCPGCAARSKLIGGKR